MKEIANLRKLDAQEAQKESNLYGKINRAKDTASKTKSNSIFMSKSKEIERASKDLAITQKKRADIADKISNKSRELYRYEEKKKRDDDRERKKISEEQKRLIREREQHHRLIESKIRLTNEQYKKMVNYSSEEEYDFFIAHASEDKNEFVRKLAQALQSNGAKVWYDEFALKIGDSLRRKIDQGLKNSRFGIVVLSENFFEKKWPNRELDGLYELEAEGKTRILPIWHKVSKDEIMNYSPLIADKIALNSSLNSVEEIAEKLCYFLK